MSSKIMRSQETSIPSTTGATTDAGPASVHSDAQPPFAEAAEAAEMARRYEDEIAAIEDDLIGEIERLQRAAAERERALIAERDAYRAQLDFVTGTKAWRASVAYWQARGRGVAGPFALGGQFAAYLLRVGYHLGVPYRLRRDLWYRRHTGRSYRSYFRMLGASGASDPAASSAQPATDPTRPANIRKVVGPDVLYFPAASWDASSMRHRRFALEAAREGRRCRWLSPRLAPASAGDAVARPIEEGIEEVTLPGDGSDVTLKPIFRRSALRHALDALTRYCYQHDLREVICVAQHPGWAPVVEALRRRYGWKVVYDLTDDVSVDLSDNAQASKAAQPDERLKRMLASSDLVVTDAPARYERLLAQGVKAALVPVDETLMSHTLTLYGRATIIIVTYRSLDKTRLTLKSVLEKTRYPNYEVLIVDNGGQPAIQAYARELAERFPGAVRCIFNDENLGFAGGNNVGLRAAKDSDYVVLLNDDVIVTPGWLGALIWRLGDQRIGLVGPVTNACGNEARIPVDYSDIAQVDAFARRYTHDHEGESFDIAVLAMYCVAMRQDTLAEIGELDERFRFGMFEDDDFAVRAHNAGYRVVCAEDVFVHHFGSASFGRLSEEAYARIFDANRTLFEQKWNTTWRLHKYREG